MQEGGVVHVSYYYYYTSLLLLLFIIILLASDGTVFKLPFDMASRGASVSWVSQYGFENELLYPPFTCLTCESFEIKNGVKYLAVRASVSTARPDVSCIVSVTSKVSIKSSSSSSDGEVNKKLDEQLKIHEEEKKKKLLELEILDNNKAFDELFDRYRSSFEGRDGTCPDMYVFLDCRKMLLKLLNSNCDSLEEDIKKGDLEKLMISLPAKQEQWRKYRDFYNVIEEKVEWANENYVDPYGQSKGSNDIRRKTPKYLHYVPPNYGMYNRFNVKDNVETSRRFIGIWKRSQELIRSSLERLLQPETSALKEFEKFETDFMKLKDVFEFANQGLSFITFVDKDPFHIEKLHTVIVKASELYTTSEGKIEEHLSVLSDKKTADASQIKSALHQIALHLDGLKVASESGYYFDVINWPIRDEIKKSLYPFEKARELYISMISKK